MIDLAARLAACIVENFADLFVMEDELKRIEKAHDLDAPEVIAALATCADMAPIQRRLAMRPPAALVAGLELALRRKLRPPAELLVRARLEAATRAASAPPAPVPAKRPRKALPAFAQPEQLPAPRAIDGEMATRDELETLVRGLQRGDDAAIDAARETYTAESLGVLGRALALGWLSDGLATTRWAVQAAARFPDDDAARALALMAQHLAPRVGQFARARELVDVLGAMGTRTSLELLGELSRVKTRSVRDRARAAFEAAAELAGTTALDLADRLMPQTGGKQVARELVKRLERRMIARTITTTRDFVENVLQHALARETASTVVFGVLRGHTVAQTFTIDADELVDLDGDPFELATDAAIVVVHPVDLSPQLVARWHARVPTQPFPQLARAVQRFTSVKGLDAEMRKLLARRESISMGRIFGLEALEWQRGSSLGGVFHTMTRELHGVTAEIELSPGVILARGMSVAQQLVGVVVRAGKDPSPIGLGEILRELTTLYAEPDPA
jgi:hypothetical protein